MSDYKPITGELRELLADINWTEILDHVHTNGGGICDGDWLDHWHEQAERLCDAIDAVHAQLEEENERLRYELDERPIAVGADAAKTIARLERENAALKERDGWVELPRDADGVPICVGDVMVYTYDNTCPLTVVAIVPPAVFLTDDGPRYADMCRHAPDTWERIIEDAVNVHGNGFNPCWTDERDALVARCRVLCERTMSGDAE